MKFISLLKNEIADLLTRENFIRIENFFKKDAFLKGNFRFFTYTFPAAQAMAPVAHLLNFVPKDVLVLSVADSDGETITWHYDDFTATNVVLTASGPCTVRAYIGRYEE